MKMLATLTEEVEEVKAAVAVLKAGKTSGRKARRDSVDDIMGMAGRLYVGEDGSVDEDGCEHDHMSLLVATISVIVEQPVSSIEFLGMFHMLMEDVKQVKNSADSSTIKFGRLCLRNLKEVNEWVGVHYTEMQYGLFIDPLLLLDRVFGFDEIDGTAQLERMKLGNQLKIDTEAETAAIISLSFSRPRLFHNGRATTVCNQNASRLNRLKTPADWENACGEGVKTFITRQELNGLEVAITSKIFNGFSGEDNSSKGEAICTICLAASVAFVSNLVNYYMDALFKKLHSHSKFTTAAAWSLTMQILDRILGDLFTPKQGIINGMKRDRVSICGHFLWSSMRTLDVAKPSSCVIGVYQISCNHLRF